MDKKHRPVGLLFVMIFFIASTCSAGRDYDEGREFLQIVELLELEKGSLVADVGAGGGVWTLRLAEHVGQKGRVFATDVKEAQVENLRRYGKHPDFEHVQGILGDEDHMGLPASCCEALLLRLVYHAFDKPDQMLKSLSEAMQPGGRVLIIDFRPEPDELTRQMAGAGFARRHFIEKWRGADDVYAILFQKDPEIMAEPRTRNQGMNKHEKINYVEFPARDIAATKEFFEKAFNWSFVDYGPTYTSFSNEGLDGGFFQSDLSASSKTGSALIVFYSNDLEQTRGKVEAAGGVIVKPVFPFPGGRRFHFADPSGNEFAVWSDAGE